MVRREDKKAGIEQKYTCCWCGYKFTRVVRTHFGDGKHSNVSSQVKCDVCDNFIKTWP